MASSSRQRRRGGCPQRVAENWERLVRAALNRDRECAASYSAALAAGARVRINSDFFSPDFFSPAHAAWAVATGPRSLRSINNIERVLQAADDIEKDDLNVARILREHAYSMARNLDPSDRTSVLLFKAGLTCVITQKHVKRNVGSIDRQNDIEILWNFYLEYKRCHRVDDMQREQGRMRKLATFITKIGIRHAEIEKVYSTLRILLDTLELFAGEASTHRLGRQILDEVRSEEYCEHNQEDFKEFSYVEELCDTRMENVGAPEVMDSVSSSSLIKGVAAVSTCADLSTKSPTATSSTQMESTLHHMPFQQLKDITNNFCHELGRGGFGVVYKGILENGQMVAVKKLVQSMPSSQEQFENEVNLLMNLKHPNIVQLVGYCYEMRHTHTPHEGKFVFAWTVESLLCLECLTNGSLDKYISGASSGLAWPTRYKIIEGISYGLQYLHEQSSDPVIHLDLKPANILLDESMVPKITDFGLSRLFDQKQTIRTKISSGTLGYMPPEYLRGIITPMSDIFSLGVIIMEVITGHREYPYEYDIRTSFEDFIELELRKWRYVLEKDPGNTSLEVNCQQIKKCLQIGQICVNPDRTKRPAMNKVMDMLQGIESMNWYINNVL